MIRDDNSDAWLLIGYEKKNSPFDVSSKDSGKTGTTHNGATPLRPIKGAKGDSNIPNIDEKATELYDRSTHGEDRTALVAKASITGTQIQNEKQKTDQQH